MNRGLFNVLRASLIFQKLACCCALITIGKLCTRCYRIETRQKLLARFEKKMSEIVEKSSLSGATAAAVAPKSIPAACNTPSTSSFVASKRPNAVSTPSASASVVVSQAAAASAPKSNLTESSGHIQLSIIDQPVVLLASSTSQKAASRVEDSRVRASRAGASSRSEHFRLVEPPRSKQQEPRVHHEESEDRSTAGGSNYVAWKPASNSKQEQREIAISRSGAVDRSTKSDMMTTKNIEKSEKSVSKSQTAAVSQSQTVAVSQSQTADVSQLSKSQQPLRKIVFGDAVLDTPTEKGKVRDSAQVSEFLDKMFDQIERSNPNIKRPAMLSASVSNNAAKAEQKSSARSDDVAATSKTNTIAASEKNKMLDDAAEHSIANAERNIAQRSIAQQSLAEQSVAEQGVAERSSVEKSSIIERSGVEKSVAQVDKSVEASANPVAVEPVLYVYVETETDSYDARPRIFQAIPSAKQSGTDMDTYTLLPMQIESFEEEQIAYQNKKPIRRVLRGLRLAPIEFARALGMRRTSEAQGRLEERSSASKAQGEQDDASVVVSQPIHGVARIVSSIEHLERCLFYEAADEGQYWKVRWSYCN
jgi:hypothetical protein